MALLGHASIILRAQSCVLPSGRHVDVLLLGEGCTIQAFDGDRCTEGEKVIWWGVDVWECYLNVLPYGMVAPWIRHY